MRKLPGIGLKCCHIKTLCYGLISEPIANSSGFEYGTKAYLSKYTIVAMTPFMLYYIVCIYAYFEFVEISR